MNHNDRDADQKDYYQVSPICTTILIKVKMRLFSYIVNSDSGFAPNPFWGYCTLACCKPTIRKTAKKDDWITGLTPKRNGNRILFAMKITEEPLTFQAYFNDPRFNEKRPDFKKLGAIYRRGDNIYQPLANCQYRQLNSRHSHKDGTENLDTKRHDLNGRFVLISDVFHYFGQKSIPLPPDFSQMIVGRAHKCRFPRDFVKKFEKFISTMDGGILGYPHNWPEKDYSIEDLDESIRRKCGS